MTSLFSYSLIIVISTADLIHGKRLYFSIILKTHSVNRSFNRKTRLRNSKKWRKSQNLAANTPYRAYGATKNGALNGIVSAICHRMPS